MAKANTKTGTKKSGSAAKAKPATKKASAKATDEAIEAIIQEVQNRMDEFVNLEDISNNLSTAQRRRLIGAGVRNYGFIDKAFDIARDNPNFLPSFLTVDDLWNDMHDFEDVRQLVWVLEKFLQVANEIMMVRGDRAFRDALFIYNNLKELSRARVPGAQPLYEALLKFFRRPRRNESEEPTMKELERDFHSLLKGRADGSLEIVNEAPKTAGGVRKIVDKIEKGKIAVKVGAQEEEKL